MSLVDVKDPAHRIPESFKWLLKALRDIDSPGVDVGEDWYPHPRLQHPTLKALTAVRHLDFADSFSCFSRGDLPRDFKARHQAKAPTVSGGYSNDDTSILAWIRKCCRSLHYGDYQDISPNPSMSSDDFTGPDKHWFGFCPTNEEQFVEEFIDTAKDPIVFPFLEGGHRKEGHFSEPNIYSAFGYWWIDDESQAKLAGRDAVEDLLRGEMKRPTRMALFVADALAPALVRPGEYTYGELEHALAYIEAMQVAHRSALLLVTVFGDQKARLTEVYWDGDAISKTKKGGEVRGKLIFNIKPMIDMAATQLADDSKAWEVFAWLVGSLPDQSTTIPFRGSK